MVFFIVNEWAAFIYYHLASSFLSFACNLSKISTCVNTITFRQPNKCIWMFYCVLFLFNEQFYTHQHTTCVSVAVSYGMWYECVAFYNHLLIRIAQLIEIHIESECSIQNHMCSMCVCVMSLVWGRKISYYTVIELNKPVFSHLINA